MSQSLDKNHPSKSVKLYVISDSVGEMSERLIYAAMSQFPHLNSKEIRKFPFLDNTEDLTEVLKDAKTEDAIVITTLIDAYLNKIAKTFAMDNDILHIDLISQLLETVKDKTSEEPIYNSSALHALDEEYFDRMSAIEFAVKYDDGKSPKGFLKSDLVLLGISRTSKTPLSMYLANRSYKVSNLPLIPEVQLAPEIFKVPGHKIFGLIASPQYIMKVRSERIKLMGLGPTSTYNDLERIKGELSYAEEVYSKLGAHVINIENRSIEETAQQIEIRVEDTLDVSNKIKLY